MASPRIEKQPYHLGWNGNPVHAIVFGRGRKTRRWAPAGQPEGYFAAFETRAEAQNFIKNGGLNVVTEIPLDMVLIAAGWDRKAGFVEGNFERFQAFCKEHGIAYYAVEKSWEIKGEIEQAKRLGFRYITGEVLS